MQGKRETPPKEGFWDFFLKNPSKLKKIPEKRSFSEEKPPPPEYVLDSIKF